VISVSDAFSEAVKTTHRSKAVVELLDADGNVIDELVVEGGTVNVARTAAFRRRAQVRAVGTDMVPTDQEIGQPGITEFGGDGEVFGAEGDVFGARQYTALAGSVAPYGSEFRVKRGVVFPDGTEELVSLGVFLLDDVDINDSGVGVTVDLSGPDRAQRVSDARWTEAYTIADGTNYATAIQNLISDRYPGAVFDFTTTSRTTPLLVLGESSQNDPWSDAQRMAHDIGCELFFDANGTCVLQEVPSPTAPSVWTIAEGDAGSPTVSFGRRLNRRTTYNVIVVRGENPAVGAPVQATARDMNPTSPTYVLGPFGEKPKFYVSEYIKTEAQAQDVANAMLSENLGLDEAARAVIVPQPALDASDVVTVTRQRSNLNAAFVVQSFSVPLRPNESMTVELKRLRDLVTGEA
jgi:hypothetical protein